MTEWIWLHILVVFSISNCICGKNFRTYHILLTRYRENNSNKEFIKIFQTNKNQFWVLLIGFSYLSRNSSFKSKNLVLYLKLFALQNENVFIQIWKIRLSNYIGVPAWFSYSGSYEYIYFSLFYFGCRYTGIFLCYSFYYFTSRKYYLQFIHFIFIYERNLILLLNSAFSSL